MRDTLTITEHQEIKIDEIRNTSKNTISHEDKELLFSIIHKDRFGRKKYVFSRKGINGLKSNSIVGSISLKNGLTVEILPKFAKNNLNTESIKKYRKTLLNIIRVSNEKNFISSTTQSSKVSSGEMPLIRYMIELFSESLLLSLRNKSFSSYNATVENSSYIRGNILVSKTIQKSLIDKSKVYISYNKYSSNNKLMRIFRTLAKLLLNDTNLSYKAKQNLYEIYLLLNNVDIINLKQYDFSNIVFNRLNDHLEMLFHQAEFIFNQYMPFSSNINSAPFWAILFDMDYLFEKFCSYLFRKSNIEVEDQATIDCFSTKNKTVSMRPDFILYDKEKIVNVVDAKWKLLSEKRLHGLDAQNFWQLFSYMNMSSEEEINGYFILPKNIENIDDEIIFSSKNKDKKDITIFSIDFSLDFEDIINKYKFKITSNKLELIKEADTIDNHKKHRFIIDEFIDELKIINNSKDKHIMGRNKFNQKFKNILLMKESTNINRKEYKALIKKNIKIDVLILKGLDISKIPSSIKDLENLKIINLLDNKLINIHPDILKLKNLKILHINTKVIKENLNIIKKLASKIEIRNKNNRLYKF